MTIQLKDPFYIDPTGHFKARNLMIVVSILSYLFHPGDNKSYSFDIQMLVSFTIYLEAAALIPQLKLFRSNWNN